MNKPKLTLVDGGKEDKVPSEGENWLANEPQGSVFLYRPFGSRRVLLNIRQLHKNWGDVALLIANVDVDTGLPPVMEYVDTQLFSNLNEKVKTIFVMPPFDAEEELRLQKERENDGNPVHPERME